MDHIKKVVIRIFFYFVWDQSAEEAEEAGTQQQQQHQEQQGTRQTDVACTGTRQLLDFEGLVRSELQGLERVKACKIMV